MSDAHEPKRKAARRTFDWPALYAEWMASGMTPNQFRISKGIALSVFYAAVEREGWWKRAEAAVDRGIKAVEDAHVEASLERWKEQEKLWRAVEVQAAALLRQTVQPDGRIKPLRPAELVALTAALERALKARRLIAGESTDNMAVGGSIHTDLVEMVLRHRRARRLEGAKDVTPKSTTPPGEQGGA